MDANKTRNTIAVNIAGREIRMWQPTEGQVMGLQMIQSDKVPIGLKMQGLSEMFLSLLPTDADKAWFVTQFAAGEYDVKDFILSLKAIMTAPAASDDALEPAAETPKKTARKTTARKTSNRR